VGVFSGVEVSLLSVAEAGVAGHAHVGKVVDIVAAA
jgi:hypothetical protein